MSELHKFLFDGLPVRGAVVRLTDAWQEVLRRRASNSQGGAYAQPVGAMLGEMAAAAVLMQANIKFDGALVLQIFSMARSNSRWWRCSLTERALGAVYELAFGWLRQR